MKELVKGILYEEAQIEEFLQYTEEMYQEDELEMVEFFRLQNWNEE